MEQTRIRGVRRARGEANLKMKDCSTQAEGRTVKRLFVKMRVCRFGTLAPKPDAMRLILLLFSRRVFNFDSAGMFSRRLISLSDKSMTSYRSCGTMKAD